MIAILMFYYFSITLAVHLSYGSLEAVLSMRAISIANQLSGSRKKSKPTQFPVDVYTFKL